MDHGKGLPPPRGQEPRNVGFGLGIIAVTPRRIVESTLDINQQQDRTCHITLDPQEQALVRFPGC